jgi:inorganic triphosphatase YgiF
MTASPQRTETLRQAAAAKHQAAERRAEAGLRQLTITGQPVTFRAVAAAGGVSVDFLYRHHQLRQRIQALRDQQRRAQPALTQPTPPPAATESNVVRTLTARLTEARAEIATLKTQLAAAHGELLTLRRRPAPATTG